VILKFFDVLFRCDIEQRYNPLTSSVVTFRTRVAGHGLVPFPHMVVHDSLFDKEWHGVKLNPNPHLWN